MSVQLQDFGFNSHELQTSARSTPRSAEITPSSPLAQGLLEPAFKILDATTGRLFGQSNTDRSRVDSPTRIIVPADEKGPEVVLSPDAAVLGFAPLAPGCSPPGSVDELSHPMSEPASRASVSQNLVGRSTRVQNPPSLRMATPPATRRRYANLISPGKEARPVASGSGITKSVFYRPNLDELEVWTSASVAPGVFATPIYVKRPANASKEREAMRSNLRAFMKTVETHPDTTQPLHGRDFSKVEKVTRPAAVSAVPRTVRSKKIIEEIFGIEGSEIQSEVTSNNISRRASPALDDSSTRTFTRPSRDTESKHPVVNHPFTHSLSRTTSSYGKATRPEEPEEEDLPFLEYPPLTEAPPVPPRFPEVAYRTPSPSVSETNRLAHLSFTIDPTGPLYQRPPGTDLLANVTEQQQPPDVVYHRTPSPSLSEANRLAHLTFRIDPTNPLHQLPSGSGSATNASLPFQSSGPVAISTSATDDQNPPHTRIDHPIDIASSPLLSLAFPRSVSPPVSPSHVIQPPPPATDPAHEQEPSIHESPMQECDSSPVGSRIVTTDFGDLCTNRAQSEEVTELINSAVRHAYANGALDTTRQLQPSLLQDQSVVGQSPPKVPGSPSPPKSKCYPPTFTSSVSLLLKNERSSLTSISMAPAVWTDVEPLLREKIPEGVSENCQTRSAPIVLDRGYLQPRYRDLWAPDHGNAFLQQALRNMVIGQVRPGIEPWDNDRDETEEDQPEETDVDELANDAESGASDVEVRDPESGVVFLSQKISDSSTTTPTSGRGVRASLRLEKKGYRSPVTPLRKRVASQEFVKGAGIPSSRKRSRTTAAAELDEEWETEGTEDTGSPVSIGVRIQRWTALLQSFLKGKGRNGIDQPELVDLKKALLEIHSDALFIAPTSPLAGYMYKFANLRPSEIPNDDKMGLRILARKFLQVWGREIPKPT
ncbi:hypothetical protein HYPSUDRAFT_87865 [Hypholoma sublateritium FD-334 SS-4]|uniref:Uncharacterized protein n=1 Tax=Hypholoma sublateritium (strain FD-334 SS-4) TaxID=945553 RepID=A0A0D2L4B6_HYPSF|nr:hypothetical protein HYPSUDRAFT_87865 [Hypholoma sublateritium FD-334 SS-4]